MKVRLVIVKLLETAELLRKQHEERSAKIKQFISKMEQEVKLEDEKPTVVSKTDNEIRAVECDQVKLSWQIECAQKRKLNSCVKRGKADLAFLKGN